MISLERTIRWALNIQLKQLEEHLLVTRPIYPVMPSKVDHELANFGNTLTPAIQAIGHWGDAHEGRQEV